MGYCCESSFTLHPPPLCTPPPPSHLPVQRGSLLHRILNLLSSESPVLVASTLNFLQLLTASLRHTLLQLTDSSLLPCPPASADPPSRNMRYPSLPPLPSTTTSTTTNFAINGKGSLSLGGGAYCIHRAAFPLASSNALATTVCSAAFDLLDEPFRPPCKLGAARLSNIFTSLSTRVYADCDLSPLTDFDTLPVSVLTSLDYITRTTRYPIVLDPYETINQISSSSSSSYFSSLVKMIDSVPTSALEDTPKVTIPAVIQSAVQSATTSPILALSNPRLSSLLSPAAALLSPAAFSTANSASALTLEASPLLDFSSPIHPPHQTPLQCVASLARTLSLGVPLLQHGCDIPYYEEVAAFAFAAGCYLLDSDAADLSPDLAADLSTAITLPLLTLLKHSPSATTLSNLALLIQRDTIPPTATAPPTLPFDSPTLTFHAPPSLTAHCPPSLLSLPLVPTRRAILTHGLLSPSLASSADLLHSLCALGPSLSFPHFTSIVSSCSIHVINCSRSADAEAATALSKIAPNLQVRNKTAFDLYSLLVTPLSLSNARFARADRSFLPLRLRGVRRHEPYGAVPESRQRPDH